MISALLVILVSALVFLLALVIFNMIDCGTSVKSDSFLDILPDQTNIIPQSVNNEISNGNLLVSYKDVFNQVYQTDASLLKNPLFADYYKNWWIPRANGRYGDWRYRNPYWFPAKYDAKPIRDSLSDESKLHIIKGRAESEYAEAREKDLKRLGLV